MKSNITLHNIKTILCKCTWCTYDRLQDKSPQSSKTQLTDSSPEEEFLFLSESTIGGHYDWRPCTKCKKINYSPFITQHLSSQCSHLRWDGLKFLNFGDTVNHSVKSWWDELFGYPLSGAPLSFRLKISLWKDVSLPLRLVLIIFLLTSVQVRY